MVPAPPTIEHRHQRVSWILRSGWVRPSVVTGRVEVTSVEYAVAASLLSALATRRAGSGGGGGVIIGR
jgi:hypothetical protein